MSSSDKVTDTLTPVPPTSVPTPHAPQYLHQYLPQCLPQMKGLIPQSVWVTRSSLHLGKIALRSSGEAEVQPGLGVTDGSWKESALARVWCRRGDSRDTLVFSACTCQAPDDGVREHSPRGAENPRPHKTPHMGCQDLEAAETVRG